MPQYEQLQLESNLNGQAPETAQLHQPQQEDELDAAAAEDQPEALFSELPEDVAELLAELPEDVAELLDKPGSVPPTPDPAAGTEALESWLQAEFEKMLPVFQEYQQKGYNSPVPDEEPVRLLFKMFTALSARPVSPEAEAVVASAGTFLTSLIAFRQAGDTSLPGYAGAQQLVAELLPALNDTLQTILTLSQAGEIKWENQAGTLRQMQSGHLIDEALTGKVPSPRAQAQPSYPAASLPERNRLTALLTGGGHSLHPENRKFTLLMAALQTENLLTRQRLAAGLFRHTATLYIRAKNMREEAMSLLLRGTQLPQDITRAPLYEQARWQDEFKRFARKIPRTVAAKPFGSDQPGFVQFLRTFRKAGRSPNPLIAAIGQPGPDEPVHLRLARDIIPLADALGQLARQLPILLRDLLPEETGPEPAAKPWDLPRALLTGTRTSLYMLPERAGLRLFRSEQQFVKQIANAFHGFLRAAQSMPVTDFSRAGYLHTGTQARQDVTILPPDYTPDSERADLMRDTALGFLDEVQQAERVIKTALGHARQLQTVTELLEAFRKIPGNHSHGYAVTHPGLDRLLDRELTKESAHWLEKSLQLRKELTATLAPLLRLADQQQAQDLFGQIMTELTTLQADAPENTQKTLIFFRKQLASRFSDLIPLAGRVKKDFELLAGKDEEKSLKLEEEAGRWLKELAVIKSGIKAVAIYTTGSAPANFSRSGMLARGMADWAQALRDRYASQKPPAADKAPETKSEAAAGAAETVATADPAAETGVAATEAADAATAAAGAAEVSENGAPGRDPDPGMLFDQTLAGLLEQNLQHFTRASDPEGKRLYRRMQLALQRARNHAQVYPPTPEEILLASRTVPAYLKRWASIRLVSGALSVLLYGGLNLVASPASLTFRLGYGLVRLTLATTTGVRAVRRGVRVGQGPVSQNVAQLLRREAGKTALRLILSVSPLVGYGAAAGITASRLNEESFSGIARTLGSELPRELLLGRLPWAALNHLNAREREIWQKFMHNIEAQSRHDELESGMLQMTEILHSLFSHHPHGEAQLVLPLTEMLPAAADAAEPSIAGTDNRAARPTPGAESLPPLSRKKRSTDVETQADASASLPETERDQPPHRRGKRSAESGETSAPGEQEAQFVIPRRTEKKEFILETAKSFNREAFQIAHVKFLRDEIARIEKEIELTGKVVGNFKKRRDKIDETLTSLKSRQSEKPTDGNKAQIISLTAQMNNLKTLIPFNEERLKKYIDYLEALNSQKASLDKAMPEKSIETPVNEEYYKVISNIYINYTNQGDSLLNFLAKIQPDVSKKNVINFNNSLTKVEEKILYNEIATLYAIYVMRGQDINKEFEKLIDYITRQEQMNIQQGKKSYEEKKKKYINIPQEKLFSSANILAKEYEEKPEDSKSEKGKARLSAWKKLSRSHHKYIIENANHDYQYKNSTPTYIAASTKAINNLIKEREALEKDFNSATEGTDQEFMLYAMISLINHHIFEIINYRSELQNLIALGVDLTSWYNDISPAAEFIQNNPGEISLVEDYFRIQILKKLRPDYADKSDQECLAFLKKREESSELTVADKIRLLNYINIKVKLRLYLLNIYFQYKGYFPAGQTIQSMISKIDLIKFDRFDKDILYETAHAFLLGIRGQARYTSLQELKENLESSVSESYSKSNQSFYGRLNHYIEEDAIHEARDFADVFLEAQEVLESPWDAFKKPESVEEYKLKLNISFSSVVIGMGQFRKAINRTSEATLKIYRFPEGKIYLSMTLGGRIILLRDDQFTPEKLQNVLATTRIGSRSIRLRSGMEYNLFTNLKSYEKIYKNLFHLFNEEAKTFFGEVDADFITRIELVTSTAEKINADTTIGTDVTTFFKSQLVKSAQAYLDAGNINLATPEWFLSLIPFFGAVKRKIFDKNYNATVSDLAWDIADLAVGLGIPALQTVARAARAVSKILKNSMRVVRATDNTLEGGELLVKALQHASKEIKTIIPQFNDIMLSAFLTTVGALNPLSPFELVGGILYRKGKAALHGIKETAEVISERIAPRLRRVRNGSNEVSSFVSASDEITDISKPAFGSQYSDELKYADEMTDAEIDEAIKALPSRFTDNLTSLAKTPEGMGDKAAEKVIQILQAEGYQTQVIGVRAYNTVTDTAPLNHYAVIASKNGQELVIDATFDQFVSGAARSGEPLMTSPEEWIRKLSGSDKLQNQLITIKQYTTLGDAKREISLTDGRTYLESDYVSAPDFHVINMPGHFVHNANNLIKQDIETLTKADNPLTAKEITAKISDLDKELQKAKITEHALINEKKNVPESIQQKISTLNGELIKLKNQLNGLGRINNAILLNKKITGAQPIEFSFKTPITPSLNSYLKDKPFTRLKNTGGPDSVSESGLVTVSNQEYLMFEDKLYPVLRIEGSGYQAALRNRDGSIVPIAYQQNRWNIIPANKASGSDLSLESVEDVLDVANDAYTLLGAGRIIDAEVRNLLAESSETPQPKDYLINERSIIPKIIFPVSQDLVRLSKIFFADVPERDDDSQLKPTEDPAIYIDHEGKHYMRINSKFIKFSWETGNINGGFLNHDGTKMYIRKKGLIWDISGTFENNLSLLINNLSFF